MQRSTSCACRPATRVVGLGLLLLAACANPDKDQYFIPLDAIEPGAGIFSTGEAIPADAYPVAVRSAVITGDLLVGGEVAQELAQGQLMADAIVDDTDVTASTAVVLSDAEATLQADATLPDADGLSPNAQRAAAFADLTEEQRDVLVADSDRALLLEAWMESRVEPVSMTRTDVLRAQQLLAQLGFDPGPQDGIAGRRTRAAIEAFQEDRGLPVTGQLTPGLMDRMGLEMS
jgi:hypothetical protein